jgi:hypothetical protein
MMTTTNIHALCGIRTHGLHVQAIKAYASDHAATGTCYTDVNVIINEDNSVHKLL